MKRSRLSDPAQRSKVFISYRRDDCGGHAGRLYDKLCDHFGAHRIFMDIDTIEPGEDFKKAIENAVAECDVLLALIGQTWLSSSIGSHRRLDIEDDVVRLEIATALKRNIRVIPVLVQGAAMPRAEDLPNDLRSLSTRNAFAIDDLHWKPATQRLIEIIEKTLSSNYRDRPSLLQRPYTINKRIALGVVLIISCLTIGTIWAVWKFNAPSPEEKVQNTNTSAPPTETPSMLPTASPTNTQPDQRNTERFVKSNPSVTNRAGIELVYVPPGSLMMGSESGDSDEKPVRRVTIRDGFYMGRYEVTQKQWATVMATSPSKFRGDNLPVEQISWYEAQEFIRRLNSQNDGFMYRLPSEAEWEYACRSGTTGDYAGNLDAIAWYGNNSGLEYFDAAELFRTDRSKYSQKFADNRNQTHPVGQKKPNSFGLYDMHGNVWEWCEDYYHDSYLGAPTDGIAWLTGGNQGRRILRGGSWLDHSTTLRSASRFNSEPEIRYQTIGFRVVAIVQQ